MKKRNHSTNWVRVGRREALVRVRRDYISELIANGFSLMKDLIYSNVFTTVCAWWEVLDKMYKLSNFDPISWKKLSCCLVLQNGCTFSETLFLGEGTDLQVTFLEMNYMSYVYYVEWMITKNGEAFKLLLPLILAIEITLWFDLFCFVLLKRNKEKKKKKYLYINIGSLCFDFSVTQCSIRRSRVRYILR